MKAEGGQEEPILGLPHRPPSLTLTDSEPLTEGQHLRPKLGIGVEADQEKVSE